MPGWLKIVLIVFVLYFVYMKFLAGGGNGG
jgi:hypothetical protein